MTATGTAASGGAAAVAGAGTGATAAAAALPARSVLLSVLLGSHPPSLPVRTLVRTAGHLGITEGSARVALSRLTAEGDVVAEGGTYRLSARHLERQRDQDAALRPPTRPWRGGWDLAIVLPDAEGRPLSGPDTRRWFERRRMAEIRPGVWTRPDNLVSPAVPEGSTDVTAGEPAAVSWTARPHPGDHSPQQLVARLWNLEGWAAGAESLLREMAAATEPAVRLSVAAAMVRHIRADPVLPPALLPPGWPGRRLRGAYDRYRAELGRLIAGLRDG